MPVATPINQPPTQQPSILKSFIESGSAFLHNYWALLLFFGMVVVAIYLIYYIRKIKKESEMTAYHKIRDRLEELSLMQANRKRLINNPMLTMGATGFIAFIVWFLCIAFWNFTGLFLGAFVAFTIFIIGGGIYYVYTPFVKRDSVYLRYREEGIIREKWVGDYAGEYYSSDGYLNLLVQKGRRSVIFKNRLIIRIPQSVKSFYDIERLEKQAETDKTGVTTKQLNEIKNKYSNFLKDLVQFNDNTIVINYAKSLDKFQFLYYPVFVDDKGQIIDKGVQYYKGLKDLTIQEALFELTDVASQASIKSILINPRVQYKQATGDEAMDDVGDEDKD